MTKIGPKMSKIIHPKSFTLKILLSVPKPHALVPYKFSPLYGGDTLTTTSGQLVSRTI